MRTALALNCQPRGFDVVNRIALANQKLFQRVPLVERVTELKGRDRFWREKSFRDVLARVLRRRMIFEQVMVMCRRRREEFAQAFAIIVLAGTCAHEFDAGALRESPQRFAEIHVLFFHQKREHIAARTTRAEAVPGTAIWVDDERRSFFVVKRTRRFENAPGFF